MTSSLHVLVVHVWLHRRDVEQSEIYETVSGLVVAAEHEDSVVWATDGRSLYATQWDDQGQLVYVRRASVFRGLLRRWDVAHVHMVLPPVQLLLAALLRLRGTPVVLTPMAMLGDDFGRASWFRRRSTLFLRVKPLGVRLLRRLWSWTATAYVVQSHEEARLACMPPDRCSLLPLPAPRTDLADAVLAEDAGALDAGAGGHVAFVTRLDTWRKGIDRLCSWVDVRRADLPRPAAVLYASDDGAARPELLTELHDEGLLVWDRTSRGQALLADLAKARGVALLSRYDGQPRVLREAALLGLPTMSTPASHFSEVVAALGTGVVVQDGDDPQQVHDGFLALAGQSRDPEGARRLFDREAIGVSLLEVLRSAAQRPPGPPVDHYTRTEHRPTAP